MDKLKYAITGMTIAVTNMEAMLAFYTNVFDIDFTPSDMYNTKLYAGYWAGFNVLFCPAHIAQIFAAQNRHQLEIQVSNIEQAVQLAIQHGGAKMGEVFENEVSKSIGIYDPDRNTILLKEVKGA